MFNFFGKAIASPAFAVSTGPLIINPLSQSPTGAYATHRVPGIQSTYIMQVRRLIAGDTVNIYDFQQGTNNYKLTELGSWNDGSNEIFFVVTWYDQSGNSRDIAQATANKQPELLLNKQNGYPVLYYDGIDDVLSAAVNMVNFRTTTAGTLISNFNPTDDAPVIATANPWYSDPMVRDFDGFIVLGRAVVQGVDKVWADQFTTVEDFVGATHTAGQWGNFVHRHLSGNLSIFKNGVEIASISSGTIGGALDSLLVTGQGGYGGGILNGYTDQLFTYSTGLADNILLGISAYCMIGGAGTEKYGDPLTTAWTNGTTNPFETFTSSGVDITSAINTTGIGLCSEAYSVESGYQYKVEFDATITGGTWYIKSFTGAEGGDPQLDQEIVNGHNTIYFSSRRTGTDYICFLTANTNETLTVSNFSLRKNTIFGPDLTDAWTNDATNPFETFTSSGVDITSAINTIGLAFCTDDFAAINGKRYRVEFDATITGGAGNISIKTWDTATGTPVHGLDHTIYAGRNVFYFNATQTDTDYIVFFTTDTTANFSISNFRLRQIL